MTWKEFKRSLTMNNFPAPSREQYNTVIDLAGRFEIDSKEELAMFLAQVFWESAGLQHTKEIACAVSKCPKSYRSGGEAPNKYYYGRGYIQLTWLENYANCSLDMYGDMRLVEDPDLVSDTTEGAWGSAFWYWWKYVHDIPEVSLEERSLLKVFLVSKSPFLSPDSPRQVRLHDKRHQRTAGVQGRLQGEGLPPLCRLQQGAGGVQHSRPLPAPSGGLLPDGGE